MPQFPLAEPAGSLFLSGFLKDYGSLFYSGLLNDYGSLRRDATCPITAEATHTGGEVTGGKL